MNGKLCRHSEFDVKVAVAACISEIARIVAPDAPYGGRKMEEAFELIVSTFEEPLVDKATSSYSKTLSKRTSILESLAKAGQMAELNCDALNTEMIQNFLKAISIRYPSNVFPYMAKILTLVLEGRAAIRPRMLLPFLYYVREDVEVPQASRRLAEKVLSNCADRLKTYLPNAVRLSGVPRENYSQIVVSICCPPLQEHQLVGNEKEYSQVSLTNGKQTRVQDSQVSLTNEKPTRVQDSQVSLTNEKQKRPGLAIDEKSLNGGDKIVTFALFCFVIYAFTR